MKTNSFKRILSLVLSIMMVMAMVPMQTVFAADTTPKLNAEGYYELATADDLYWFAEKVNSGEVAINAVLTDDIVVNENVVDENGELIGDGTGLRNWIPIGANGMDIGAIPRGYEGVFDGQNHTISGLYGGVTFEENDGETTFTQMMSGLFLLNSGVIKNVGVINGYFGETKDIDFSMVGGICCANMTTNENLTATVDNCYSSLTINADHAAGICTQNFSVVNGCYNEGNITASYEESFAAGIVGTMANEENGIISNCYNKGKILSDNICAGIVASADINTVIKNCYNTGKVVGANVAGGIAGDLINPSSYHAYVYNCYNTGVVTGTTDSAYVGAICGNDESEEATTNCYYLAENETDELEGTLAKTEDEFASGEVAYLLQGEQTEEIWGQKIGTDDYPTLDGDKVYYGYVSCADDATIVYTNNAEATAEKPDHTWVDGKCTVCENDCEHSWEDGKCTVCEKDCEHDWYYGTCDICGKECSHPEHTLEMEVYPEEDDAYYVSAEAYCSTCGDYLFYYSDYAEVVSKEEAKDCLNKGSVTLSFTYYDYDNNSYTATKTIEVESDNHVGTVENGFCSACSGYEFAKYNEETGVYEIANAGQLYWFAEQVNVYNNSISAKLVADIIVNEDMSAENLIEWTPIGSSSSAYCGNFDGQGHTVSGLYCVSDERFVGFFGRSDYNYKISNLGITNSYFEGDSYIGAIVGYASSIISNCFVDNVEVVCNGNICADFVGYNIGEISNSYSVTDSFVGNSYYGTITNCYYLADEETDSYTGTTAVSADAFASGEVAYLLQAGVQAEDIYDDEWNYVETITPEVWGQKIGTDSYPVLGGDKVYQVENCKGEFGGYSNTDEPLDHNFKNGVCSVCGEACEHNFETGFCTVCGAFGPATLNEDGVYEISNAGQLYWFANEVNSGKTSINAILTANIVVNEGVMDENSTDAIEWTPIGNYDNKYTGTFDGNDHYVSGLYFNNNETGYVGLFGYVSENGVVKNTGVINSYFNGSINVGGVVGENYGTIENCYNTGTVNCNDRAGGVVGGNCGTIVNCYNTGYISSNYSTVGGVSGGNTGTIINCYNIGDVSGMYRAGGVVGYNYKGTITNCYNTGEVNCDDRAGGVVGLNSGTITNCYYLDTAYDGGIGMEGTTDAEDIEGSAEAKTSKQFASGEVAHLLQGEQEDHIWGQKIGTDELPVFGGDKVYTVTNCIGEVSYNNTKDEILDHNYENGFCTVCEAFEPATLNEDGVYEIDNAGQLYWFADKVNNDYENFGSANAILTADIVVNEGTMSAESTDARAWTPIGNYFNRYSGVFDGNNYTISGFYINGEIGGVGLFYYVGENGTVKNTGIINSYINGSNYVGGVVANNYGTIENCYNTGKVSGNDVVGGMVGDNYGTITNCYNTGEVSGDTGVGGVAGYNRNSTITNCYNEGVVNGGDYVGGVAGYNSDGTIKNCYSEGTVSGSGYGIGGVVGVVINGTIENCYNTGTVVGSGSNFGGVVGDNRSTVTNCYNEGVVSGSDYAGGVVGYNHSTIENSYNTGKVSGSDYVGGVVGDNRSTVTNCYNTGEVSGSDYAGGVVGYNCSTIENSYNTGVVSRSDYAGGVVGFNYGTITNCYYLDTAYTGGIDGEDVAGSAEAKTTQQFASGEVAYLLGEAFGQKLGTDELPVLGGDKVYYGYTSCRDDATIVYTNNAEATAEKPDHTWVDGKCTVCGKVCQHTYENGFCTVCDGYEPATLNEDGIYEIGNVGQLYWFADKVNNDYENFGSANAILTADIVVNKGEMSAESTDARAWTPIGKRVCQYTGTFDGNDHTVSGIYFNNSEADYVGLFGCVGENGAVKNTGVVNSYINGQSSVGGVIGYSYGTITNCYNTGNVSGSSVVGGLVGENYGTIENCYNTGNVSGSTHVGGAVGFNFLCKITNCYNIGTVNGDTSYIGGVIGRSRSSMITNCYYLDTAYDGSIGKSNTTDADDIEGLTEAKTAQQFASGEVACLLQGEQEDHIWGQKIGTDELPTLGGDKVYQVANCVDETVYSNTNENLGHSFENCVCSVCGALTSSVDADGDGYYDISNADELYAFAELVNSGYTDINGELLADIVVNEGTMSSDSTDAREWTPISNYSSYTGTFDGNDHYISGIYFNNSEAECAGLFGYVSASGTVKNTGVINSYFNSYVCVGGLAGVNNGKIENCYNTSTVSGSKCVGGLVGENYGTIENCYNTGIVSGSNYVGGVAGYNESTITNCYYLDTACIGGIGKYNFADAKDIEGSAEAKNSKQFASGEVAYLLQAGIVGEDIYDDEWNYIETITPEVWGQNIDNGETPDSYPVLGGDKVYQVENCKGEFGGYSNTDEPLDHNFKNGVCSVCGEACEHNFENGFCTICGISEPTTPSQPKNGIYEEDGGLYYYKDGARYYAGLILIDGDYYYVNSSCKVIAGKSYYISKTNGLLPSASYKFDETGKMINPPTVAPDDEIPEGTFKNGIIREDGVLYYYVDGVKTYAGLIKIDGDYYYVNSSCKVIAGMSYYISKTNNLLPSASYTFDETGKMVNPPAVAPDDEIPEGTVKNGIIREDGTLYYYVNGEKNYAGLIIIDGDYYYVNSSCKVIAGMSYYISKTNGYLERGSYKFDAYGKMVK